jgi:hypothetical protein
VVGVFIFPPWFCWLAVSGVGSRDWEVGLLGLHSLHAQRAVISVLRGDGGRHVLKEIWVPSPERNRNGVIAH